MQAFEPDSIKPCYQFAKDYGFEGPRVPTCLYKGCRIRVAGQQVYFRPMSETFAEFKYQHLKFILGKPWWMHQARQPLEQMHAIMQCAIEYHAVARRHVAAEHPSGQVFSAPPT